MIVEKFIVFQVMLKKNRSSSSYDELIDSSITSYIHGDVLTIGVLLLIICLAWGNLFVSNGWKGVYVFAWIIHQTLGLKEVLVRQQSWDWV